MKKAGLLAISILSATVLFACGGSKPSTPEGGKPAQGQQQVVPPMGKPVVEVPASVKGKWKGVVILVMDKEKKSTTEHKLNLGEKFKLPGSDLSVDVKEYFPSFVMQGSKITSISNDTDNPAAQVVVSDGGTEIFNGWLFANFPTTHAFSHPRYAITLKGGIAK